MALCPCVHNTATHGMVGRGCNHGEITMPQTYIDFAFVKEHASFEAVLTHYNLQKIRSGDQWAVLCPFHRERKPSCKIHPQKKVFHCFGCEERGNVLEFVAKIEGDEADLRAAAVKLAEICHITLAAPRGVSRNGAGVGESPPHRAATGTVDAQKPPSDGQKRTTGAREAPKHARRGARSAHRAEKSASAVAE